MEEPRASKPISDGLEFLTIGRVLAPWGVKGEVKVEVMTDFPERFASQQRVYISGCDLVIEKSRWRDNKVVLKLCGIDSIDDAQNLRGQYLEVHRANDCLAKGQYYQFQIIGLEVWTNQGELLGEIADILSTKSNDVYLVRSQRGELLIPAIEDVVKSVDLEERRMVIELIQGLA